MKRLAAALAAASLASCGGPTLYAEIEIPELKVTLPRQQVPAFDSPAQDQWCDPSGIGDPPCVALTPSIDLAQDVPALNDDSVTTELRLTNVTLTLVSTTGGTVTDLSGIRSATVYVGSVVVASYTRTTLDPPPTSLAVTGKSNLDLSPYLSSGVLPVRVEAVIDGSTPAFQADFSAAFYVRMRLDYGRTLGI